MGASSTGPAASWTLRCRPLGRPGGLRRWIPLVVDHLQRAVQFLLGDEQRRIDRQCLLELGDRFVQLAVIAQFLALMNNRGGSLETNAFEGSPIAQIFGLQVVGLLEKIVGRFEILTSLCVLTLGVEIFGFIGDGGERYNRDQQQQ